MPISASAPSFGRSVACRILALEGVLGADCSMSAERPLHEAGEVPATAMRRDEPSLVAAA
jgi:hypothetical protein